MPPFAKKFLVAPALITAMQVLLSQATLAMPIHHAMLQSSDSTRNSQRATTGAAIELRTDTEGVDFNSYLRGLYLSVKDKWHAGMPPSVQSGQQGKNTVQFRVLEDGTIPENSLKVIFSSEKKDLDEASLQAVRKAAPFSHLPEKYSHSFIELRMTFYYNTAPQRPQ
jgi:TonB family protein